MFLPLPLRERGGGEGEIFWSLKFFERSCLMADNSTTESKELTFSQWLFGIFALILILANILGMVFNVILDAVFLIWITGSVTVGTGFIYLIFLASKQFMVLGKKISNDKEIAKEIDERERERSLGLLP